MNIEIANRLLQLRKDHQLSQEVLAAKLNISRQAVSKWERAEASPDTENLIELSKLYGISLDELLTGEKAAQTAQSADAPQQGNDAGYKTAEQETKEEDSSKEKWEGDHVSFRGGIHVRSANGERVDVGPTGVHVEDQNGEKVHVGFDGIRISDETGTHFPTEDFKENFKGNWHDWGKNYKKQTPFKFWYAFPYPLLATILFLVFGFCGGWAWSWVIFLTIPLYYTTITAIQKANPNIFCYPALAGILFFLMGFWCDLWHPGWIIFLTIPFYYWLANTIFSKERRENFQFESDDHNHPDLL